MPTIREEGPYRFFFYSADRSKPPHVHVERERNKAKFWLDPVRLQNRVAITEMKSIVFKD